MDRFVLDSLQFDDLSKSYFILNFFELIALFFYNKCLNLLLLFFPIFWLFILDRRVDQVRQ